jgi:hypothetical protein
MLDGEATEVFSRIQEVEDWARDIEALSKLAASEADRPEWTASARAESPKPQKAPAEPTQSSLTKSARRELSDAEYMQMVGDTEVLNIARREHPNNFGRQRRTYDDQLEAKLYMQSVTDYEVQQIAQRERPGDFAMQKYVYDDQLEAKLYMQSVTDYEVQQIAQRERPGDFAMQKYVYDDQLESKLYMQSRRSSSAKREAQQMYPDDYAMQKYQYDQLRSRR